MVGRDTRNARMSKARTSTPTARRTRRARSPAPRPGRPSHGRSPAAQGPVAAALEVEEPGGLSCSGRRGRLSGMAWSTSMPTWCPVMTTTRSDSITASAMVVGDEDDGRLPLLPQPEQQVAHRHPSNAANGSSISRTGPSSAKARTSATRCCMPPDNLHGGTHRGIPTSPTSISNWSICVASSPWWRATSVSRRGIGPHRPPRQQARRRHERWRAGPRSREGRHRWRVTPPACLPGRGRR